MPKSQFLINLKCWSQSKPNNLPQDNKQESIYLNFILKTFIITKK